MEMMDEKDFERLEGQIRRAAADFAYPPTPPVGVLLHRPAGAADRRSTGHLDGVGLSRRWVAALMVAVVLFVVLSVPRVRAAVAEFIQIGVVRIFRQTPNDLPEMPAPPPTQVPGAILPLTATAGATQALDAGRVVTADELTGATTLDAVRRELPFPVLLPAYPPDLGPPDGVYLQNMDGFMLVLVWMDPAQPERPELALHAIQPGSWAITKVRPQVLQETSVGGRPAVWAVGPYLLLLQNGDAQIGRLVEGNVLIWELDGITYRLETDLPLEEALKIAESLQ